MNRKEKALEISEALLEEMELKKIDEYSVIIKCLSIARLIDDIDSMTWLLYELGGYPINLSNELDSDIWDIAKKHGRCYLKEGKEYIFTQLVSELTSSTEVSEQLINSISAICVSASDTVYIDLTNLTNTEKNEVLNLRNRISTNEKWLSILRSQYYEYALEINVELRFSNKVTTIIDMYEKDVDLKILNLSSGAIKKLHAIEKNANSGKPELLPEVLATCKGLFEEISNMMFNKYFPERAEKYYKTKSVKDILTRGDQYLKTDFQYRKTAR